MDSLERLTGLTGVGLVVANVLADQLGIPLPAVPALILAGALVWDHYGWASAVFLGSVVACLIGDSAWYFAGRTYGNRVMRLLCLMSLTPDSCVSDTQRRFESWGGMALVVAKFVPGLSVVAAPLAGALRMRIPRFVYLTLAGSALWVGAWLLAGALLSTQIRQLLPRVSAYGGLVLLVAGVLLAAYISFKWLQRRRFYSMLRMARISVDDLYDLMQSHPPPVVIDVRSHTARTLDPRSIPGALHVPVDAIGTHVTRLPREREVILYCTCPNEASAAQVAKILIDLGFKRVRPLHGGLEAWVDAGYPVDGNLVSTLERATGSIPDVPEAVAREARPANAARPPACPP